MANDPAVPPPPDGFVLQGAPAAPAPAPAPDAPPPPDGFTVQTGPIGLPVGQQHPMAGPSGDTLTDIGRRVRGAAVDAGAGIASLPRSIASGIDWLGGKVGLNPGADAALASVPNPVGGGNMFPTYGQAKDAGFNVTGNVEYVPQTFAGRLVDQGMAAGLGAMAGGGPRAIPGAFTGGAAAEGAQELAPPWAKLPVAFAAFALGNKAGGAAANTVARAASIPVTPPSDLYQAYERQGVPTTLGGDVTQNPTMQFAQAFAAKMPGGEEAIKAASQQAVSAWQAAAEKRASMLGSSATMQDAGTTLQKSANDWLSNFKTQSNNLWGNFKMLVPGATPVPVSNLQTTLGNITQQYGGADGLAKVLQPKMAADLQSALTVDAPNGAIPWQALQSARSRIGEMLESPDPIADTGKAALKQIYGAMTADMKAGAAGVSQNAATAFDKANAFTAAGHGLLDDHITPILNATNPEQAAQYAMSQMRTGGSRVAALDQALPGVGGELGAVTLRQAAQNGPGRFPAAMSDARLSPEAKAVLFQGAVPDIDDLTAIANAQKTTAAMANHSNTAVTDARGVGRLLTAAELARTGREMFGTPGGVAGFAAGMFSPELMGGPARMIATNPALTRLFSTPAPAPFGVPGALTAPGALARAPVLAHPLWPSP